jgi:hypothetical protein
MLVAPFFVLFFVQVVVIILHKPLDMQLPAYVLPGLTLVISPLVALMADQLQHLPPLLPGGLINSSQVPSWILMVWNLSVYGLCCMHKSLFLLQNFILVEMCSLPLRCRPGKDNLSHSIPKFQ